MPGDEIDDDDIVERLGRIFKDMPSYTPCPVPEYSAAHPPNEVSSHTQCTTTDYVVVVVLTVDTKSAPCAKHTASRTS
jgi:hypothetical protein